MQDRLRPSISRLGASVRQVCTVSLSTAIAALVMVLLTVAVTAPQFGVGIAAASSESLGIELRDLPASVRAGDGLRVLVDVPSGAVCEGLITYRDNTTQILSRVNRDDDRCKWDITVPDGTRRGEADL